MKRKIKHLIISLFTATLLLVNISPIVLPLQNGFNITVSASSITGLNIVTASSLNLRDNAGTFGKIITSINKGTLVYVDKVSGNWSYISSNNSCSNSGWVCNTYLSSSIPYSTNIVNNTVIQISPECATISVLDVDGGKTSDGTNVHIWKNEGKSNQKFKAIYCGDGYYKFFDVNSGKCINVSQGISADYTNIQLYHDDNTKSCLWRLIPSGDNCYYIVSALNNSYSINIYGGGNSNANNVILYHVDFTKSCKMKLITPININNAVSKPSSPSFRSSYVRTYYLKKDGENSVSANFKVKEFRSKDGSNFILIDDLLIDYLQAIRSHFNRSVNINSGYRTASHNVKIGGAKNSKHLEGKAADISIYGVSPLNVARYAQSIGIKGIEYSSKENYVHIDTRSINWYFNKDTGRTLPCIP